MSLGFLVSYAYPGDVSPQNESQKAVMDAVDKGAPLVVDSGAFSVHTGRATITVEEHAKWVLTQPHTPNRRYIGLDVIGNAEATLENYKTQRSLGAPVEPTIHFGAPISQVKKLLDVADTQWINVGGLVATGRGGSRAIAGFIAAVRKNLPPEVKIHALGCTTPAVLRQVGLDAVDSSSWLSAPRYRQLSLFDDKTGRWRNLTLGSNTTATRELRWQQVYSSGVWLRTQYGVTPTQIIEKSNDRYFLLRLAIEGVSRLGQWLEQLHNRPITMYLAGSDPSTTARVDAVLDNMKVKT